MQSHINDAGSHPPQSIDEGLNLVPIENKYALLHACMVCPDLVHRESPPLKFLEFENYNFFAAAKRWAKYWDVRLKVYGEDRAFLPIADLTGNGALTEDLIPYVATGSAVILPPDIQQRPVLFIDRSRLPPQYLHWSDESRKKLGFALLQKIMLLSQSFVVIFFVSTKPTFLPGLGNWFKDALNEAFPTKLCTIHVTYTSPMSPRFKNFVTTYLPTLLHLSNGVFRQFEVNFHICDKNEMISKLTQFGLHCENLPEIVGGTWKYDIYDDYIQRLRRPISTSPPVEVPISSSVLTMSDIAGNNCTDVNKNESNSGLNHRAILNSHSDLSLAFVEKATLEEAGPEQRKAPPIEAAKQETSSSLNSVADIADMPSHIAEKEADIKFFMTLENGDTEKATSRVVSYWNFRKTIFRDRAFHPLQLHTGGALHDDDLLTLKCGYIGLLPSNREGRRVLFCDASRLAKDNIESRVRCFFYMLHIAKVGSESEDTGISILFIMNKLSFERTKVSKSLADMFRIYPAKISAFHIIRQPARLGIAVFEEKVVPTLKSLFNINDIPFHVHSGTPTLKEELAAHGFEAKNIPRSIGGGWSYEDFLKWRDQQIRLETSTSLQNEPTSVSASAFAPLHLNSASDNYIGPSSLSNVAYPVQLLSNSHPLLLPQQNMTDQHQLIQLQQQFELQQYNNLNRML